jgi:nucleoside phosphorylase
MLKILVVDDDPDRYAAFRSRVIGKYVTEEGLAISTNQKDALSRFSQDRYDVAIIDMQLPATPWTKDPSPAGGIDLLEHLLQDDDLLVPKYVIGITGSVDADQRVSQFFENSPWVLIRDGAAGTDWEGRLEKLISHADEVENTGSRIQYGVDICVITALPDPEQKALINAPFNWDADPTPVDSNTFVRTGRLDVSGGRSLNVIAGCSMRMGGTEAALLSAKLIERYRPRILVMAGICAGLEKKTAYGDPILATKVWDWTSSKWDIDEHGTERILPSPDYIEVGRDIVSRFRLLNDDSTFKARLRESWPASPPDTVLTLRDAPCASGPIVVADGKTLPDIKEKQNRDVLALEMEAYGVHCATRMASHPSPITFSIKSVCDFADPRKNDAMQKYASYTSAQTVYEFLRRYATELIANQTS